MQRHRNPANGFRSNPIGIGGGVAGGPGYRSYNRGGFGRGQGSGPGPVQPKVFQSGPTQPPPPRRIDVFLEAGKLASEYLASKGLLPPNSSNGKWQNSNLKNPIGGGGGGVSDAVSDTGGVRRRFPDEIRTRRTMGSFKNPAFEWNREMNRSSSWSEKVKEQRSSDKQGDSDSVSESMEEQRPGKDGEQKSVSGDLESKSYEPENAKPVIENKPNEMPDDNVGIKTPNSDVSHQDHVEYVDKNDSLKNPNNTSEVMTDEGNQEAEKPIVKEEPTHENNGDENNKSSSGSDLLTLIRFNKVPTRTRSSVTLKGSKSDSHLTSINENHNKTQNSLQDVSMGDAQSEENQGCSHEIKTEDIPSEEKVGHGLCTRSQSFPQRSSVTEQDLGEGHHGYSRSSSEVLGRGEKRPLHLNESPEPAKKPREWVSVNPEGRSGISQPSNVYAEEKQLFPSSFKICDLNLMEVSDVNENHESNSVIGFKQAKQEPVSVDFDLSMNSSCDVSDRHTRRGSDGKAIEVIDLDCDSVQDDKVFNSSERRDEAIFTDLESFPDSMQRVSDMPQDGYGLMISELLEADIPNSTVPTGVSSMHNEMSLQNEEGILGDDESIYMSLGEIPISFVPVWDQQPSQGYDKRY